MTTREIIDLACAWWPRARTLAERKRVLRELRNRSSVYADRWSFNDALKRWSRKVVAS